MSDKELIVVLRKGGRHSEKAVTHLMKQHMGMMREVQNKLHLTDQQAKDAFADALSHVIWNIKTSKFKGDSKLSTYLYQVYSNKAVDLLRHISTNKNRTTQDIESISHSKALLIEDNIDLIHDAEVLKEWIYSLGVKCKGILMDWAFWGYGMAEIAERNGLDSPDKAKRHKYNCLQKLRAKVDTSAF